MSILPINNSPVYIPGSAIYPPGEYTGAISSPTQKSIFETIAGEGRSAIFNNPVGSAINGLDYSLSDLYNTVTNSECLSGGDKTSLLNAIGTSGGVSGLRYQLDRFNTHTRILSGVIPQGTNATPGIDRILSVGRSLGNLAYAVEGAQNCFSLLNSMTGLFSEDLLNGYTSEIAGILEQINNCIADVTGIIYRLNEIAGILNQIIDSDNNFFNNALNQLQNAAISALLESMYANPCGKFMLDNRIGTDKLLKLLRRR